MSSYDEALKAIASYKRRYRKGGLPPLCIGGVYDLFPHLKSRSLSSKVGWPDTWPNWERAGVYMFFTSTGKLLYVGKSSMNSSIAARLSAHFKYGKDYRCVIKNDGWTKKPRFVVTIGVPESMPFEAPAMEEFLIGALHPIDNMVGRRD